MNAPTPFIFLPLTVLQPSPTNPRKRFDEKKLNELAESIKTQGVLQPILVRPFADTSGRVEIIAGERRWRAATIAGLNDVPCLVRDLTDTQVLHAQVIENLQRDDLHELEEAEGYERLLKAKDAYGKPYTVEAIAAEVGKSKRYVYARMQLLDLCEEARQACFDGKLSASTALLIAAIPLHKLQLEALADVTEDEDQYEMSYREAKEHIRNKFMTDLARAPFDITDAKLLPRINSCTDCTSRTGNQPGLFDAIESEDVCTNTSCFAMKKAAHILDVQNEAEKHGHVVINGEEAKKAIPNRWNAGEFFWKNDLTDLDDEIENDPENRTWRQVLEQHNALKPDAKTGHLPVRKTVIENPHQPGTLMEGINIEQATQALREMGFVIERKEAAQKPKTPEQLAKEAEDKARLEAENAYRLALFQANGEQIAEDLATIGVRPGLFLMLAEYFWHDIYHDSDIEALIGEKYLPGAEWDDVKARLPELSPQQHLQLIFDLMMANELNLGYRNEDDKPDAMLQIAGVEEVDHEAIRAAHEYKAPGGDADPLYDQAVEIVLKSGRASISQVQRHLRIGYNRAARLVEDMERAGLVSPVQSDGNREVIAPTDPEAAPAKKSGKKKGGAA